MTNVICKLVSGVSESMLDVPKQFVAKRVCVCVCVCVFVCAKPADKSAGCKCSRGLT